MLAHLPCAAFQFKLLNKEKKSRHDLDFSAVIWRKVILVLKVFLPAAQRHGHKEGREGGKVGTFRFWSFPRMVNLSIWHGHGMGWNLVIIFLGSLALGLTFSGLSTFPEFPKFLECSKFLEFSVS